MTELLPARARVYIAGPYRLGGVTSNVAKAIEVGNQVAMLGFVPFIPHLNHFWHEQRPHDVAFWMNQDLYWLGVCDVVLRMPGYSIGADQELREAMRMGKPIVQSVKELVKKFCPVDVFKRAEEEEE